MDKSFINQFQSYQSTCSNALKELGDIHKRGLEDLTKHQVETFHKFFDSATAQMKLLSEVKDYRALVAGQSAVFTSYGEEALSYAGKSRERMESWATELQSWFGKHLGEVQKLSGLKAF